MSLSERQQFLVSHEYHSSFTTLVQLLSPFAPHIASQLWEGEYMQGYKRCMLMRGGGHGRGQYVHVDENQCVFKCKIARARVGCLFTFNYLEKGAGV